MAQTCFRFLIAALLAVTVELLRLTVAGYWPAVASEAVVRAQQSNLVPQGLDPNTGGYGRNPTVPNNYGPMGPTSPTAPTRPTSWPGGAQDPARPVTPPPGVLQNPPPGATTGPPPTTVPKKSPADPPYDPASILARVGAEVVQANEILPTMHQTLAAFLEKNPGVFAQASEEEKSEALAKWQRDIMQRSLDDFIKIKLLLSEVRSKVPAEALSKNEERIRKDFNDNHVKQMLENYKVASVIDLENKLREQGSSLEAQRRVYAEKYLAIGWLRQQIKDEPEPNHEQMLTYYKEHLADWETPARAQWEQISLKYDKFESKEAAARALAKLGNDMFVRGVPFAVVAKAHSQDSAADEGGRYDWTTKDSLKSEKLNQAIFSSNLPESALSQIIEDDDAVHIVRIIKREDLRRAPFNECQPEIKKRLSTGNQEKAMMAYIEKLREHTPVWSRFTDGANTMAAPPQTAPRR